MKITLSQKLLSLLAIIFSLMTSCGIENNPAIDTEIALPTAAFLETMTTAPEVLPIDAITPTPNSVETGINLEISDFPPGFTQIPSNLINVTDNDLSGKAFSNENLFLFFNSPNDQLVTGFTTL